MKSTSKSPARFDDGRRDDDATETEHDRGAPAAAPADGDADAQSRSQAAPTSALCAIW